MDPDATLARIREQAAADRMHGPPYDSLAEHVQALDEWLSNGGFLPEAWRDPLLPPLDPNERAAILRARQQ